MTLRIYADFNSMTRDAEGDWCWCLRHNGRVLDDCAQSLRLAEGMPVTLYYEDEAEEFEVGATLGRDTNGRWMALVDWTTFRRLRG